MHSPRTILIPLLLAVAMFASACSSGQPVTVGLGQQAPDTAPPTTVPDTDLHNRVSGEADDAADNEDEDGDSEYPDEAIVLEQPYRDDAGNPIEPPPEQTEPDEEDPGHLLPEQVIEPDHDSPEDRWPDSPYCSSFATLTEAGESQPATAIDAEAMLTTMRSDAQTMITDSPENLLSGTQEMSKFLDIVAELAAAQNWDPEWFDTLDEEAYVNTGLDLDALELFFEDAEAHCEDATGPAAP